MANLLSKIQGAGAVEVMLSLRTGEHTIYQTDTQRQTGSEEETLRQETCCTRREAASSQPSFSRCRRRFTKAQLSSARAPTIRK